MTIRSRSSSKEYQDGWDRIFAAQRLMCPICEGTGLEMKQSDGFDYFKCIACNGTGVKKEKH